MRQWGIAHSGKLAAVEGFLLINARQKIPYVVGSGMTFGFQYSEACTSTFSTLLQALTLVVITPFSGLSIFSTYEVITSIYVSSGSSWSTCTTPSTKILSMGLAIADPIVVAW